MFVGDYLARRCSYQADAIALIDVTTPEPRRHTYRDLNQRADRAANWLRGRGIGPGDRVALLAGDGIACYDLFFACSKIGAVFVPLNTRLHPAEMEGLAAVATPELAVCAQLEAADALRRTMGQAVVPLEDALVAWDSSSDQPAFEESVGPETIACLLFTGGTTGFPKAAEISHRHVVWNTFNALLADVLPSDTYLNIFPLFHSGGLFAFTVPLLIMGGTVVQPARFEPAETLRLIASERVTIFAGVPTVFQMLADSPQWAEADLSGLRYCLSGGAPMPVPLIERYAAEHGVVFRQGFGMTEFGPDVFSLSSADAVRKAGSIGKPNFFVDAAVVHPQTGERLPAGPVGELVLRGPAGMSGYFGNPEATAAAFDGEGWFHTGDLARFDEEGYCFIVDRLKEMFVSGGENVFPAEVEAVIRALPGVSMCAVVGVPDDKWGEVGVAFVVPAPGADLAEEQVIAHVRGRLAGYKTPRRVLVVSELPLSGVGKVLKAQLKEMAR
jgi:fatty-acyl-CoA synthase